MSAPVRVDGEAFTDPRIEILAALAGYSRYEALGRLAHLWSYCTGRGLYQVSAQIVDLFIGSSGAFVQSELGELEPSGLIRVRGTAGRIEWIERLRANSLRGGLANKRRLEAVRGFDGSQADSQLDSQSQARAKPEPSPLTLTLTPTLTNKREDQNENSQAASQAAPRKKRGRPAFQATAGEAESVRVVLGKLGAKNGVSYAGSPAHVRLIVGRLRDGYTEMDLRKVIAYCAERWSGDPKMAGYLRPETLFGPETITRYVDAARAWFDSLPREERAG